MTAPATGILSSQQSVQPQPADYSLPGVMRYLQTEWQRNERDRIQWNLERAEMKTRIAKLEGDKRSLELVVDGHVKKIAILEAALEQQQLQRSDTTSHESGDNSSKNAFIDGSNNNNKNNLNGSSSSSSGYSEKARETQAERDLKVKCMEAEIDLTPIIESRIYLEKCIQEVDYLLQSSHISNNGGSGNSSGSVDDEEEGEEEEDDNDRHQQQHSSHTVNNSFVNTLSHATQDRLSDVDADRQQHVSDVYSTTSSTSTITN